MQEAVDAGELTEDQVEGLMPLIDREQVYNTTENGTFGVNKTLTEGQFSKGEVSNENRDAAFKRVVEANLRGEIHDYDVSSIMAALYTGWRWQDHTPEEEYAYNLTVQPRWRIGEEGG